MPEDRKEPDDMIGKRIFTGSSPRRRQREADIERRANHARYGLNYGQPFVAPPATSAMVKPTTPQQPDEFERQMAPLRFQAANVRLAVQGLPPELAELARSAELRED